jgi:iron complex outermembrane receptor protein
VRVSIAQNFLNPVLIANPNLAFAARPKPTRIDDRGLYFFDRLSFNDIVQLLGGIRFSDYRDSSIINGGKTFKATPTSLSGGVVVKPVKWISAYGTYIEGFEGTPAAPIATENNTDSFPPTNSIQYEAGIKLEPKDNLLIQAAYFDIDRGASYQAINPTTGNQHYYTDGRERYRGFEFSLTGNVIDDLALYATFTALSAHYNQTPNIAGKRVEGTPKNTWSLAGEYTVSWLDPGLKLTAGAYHTGTQALNAANNAFTDPYTTFDLGGSYTFTFNDHQLVARVNAQNITGKRYWAATGANILAENLPSLVKFSLSFKY